MASYKFDVDDGDDGDVWYFGDDDNEHEDAPAGPPLSNRYNVKLTEDSITIPATLDPLSLDPSKANSPWDTPEYWASGELWDKGIETERNSPWHPKRPAVNPSQTYAKQQQRSSGLNWRPTQTTQSNFGAALLTATESKPGFSVEEVVKSNGGVSPAWLEQVLTGQLGSNVPKDDPNVSHERS